MTQCANSRTGCLLVSYMDVIYIPAPLDFLQFSETKDARCLYFSLNPGQYKPFLPTYVSEACGQHPTWL